MQNLKNFSKDMTLKIDYNNMMADFVGEKEGFTDKLLSSHKKLAEEEPLNQANIKARGEIVHLSIRPMKKVTSEQKQMVMNVVQTKLDTKLQRAIGASERVMEVGPISVFLSITSIAIFLAK